MTCPFESYQYRPAPKRLLIFRRFFVVVSFSDCLCLVIVQIEMNQRPTISHHDVGMPESTTQKKGRNEDYSCVCFFVCACVHVGKFVELLHPTHPKFSNGGLAPRVFLYVCYVGFATPLALSPTPHRRKHLQHGMARIAGGCGAGVDAKADIDVVAVCAAVLVVVVALAMSSSTLPSARHSVFGTGRGIHTYTHIYIRVCSAQNCVFGCVGNVFWCARSRSVGGGAHSSMCLYVFVGSLHSYTFGQSCVSAAM